MKSTAWRWLRVTFVASAVIAASSALADPPAQIATARKKGDPYIGYTGREWKRDYGVMSGACSRKAIGSALGAVKTPQADGSNRTVAVVVGGILGAVIGREIGRKFDDRDRACFGHSLELVPEGHSVKWTNERTSVTYLLEPHGQAQSGGTCRTFKLTAKKGDKSQSDDGRACRNDDGTWKKV